MELQVVFVLDCTASMQPWITAAKNQIQRTIESVRGSHTQVALVCYRDRLDRRPLEVLTFTDDLDIVTERLDRTNASGGGDICEDLGAALIAAGALEWNPAARRLCFIITDAPAHGLRFHTHLVEDDYPEDEILADGVSKMCDSAVLTTFIRIDFDTDKMTDYMLDEYAKRDVLFTVEQLIANDPNRYMDERYPDQLLTVANETLNAVLTRHLSLETTLSQE